MIVIDPTYNGPPDSGHGGVAAGRFAELVDPRRATVRLLSPIPLDTELVPDAPPADGGKLTVRSGPEPVATVLAAGPDVADEFPLPAPDAVAAAESWWLDRRHEHPYPTCFGCGPDRPPGDGLHLCPGPVEGLGVFATTWRPPGTGEVPAWLVWAALDCGGAGEVLAEANGALILTGELAVDIRASVAGGEELVIVSRIVARAGRRTRVATALIHPGTGRTRAVASAIWFTLGDAA